MCALAAVGALMAPAALAARPRARPRARSRIPTAAPGPTVLAGPSAAIDGLNGLSVARDGTGGLVFTQDVGGVAHVFVSALLGGAFQTPVQADPGLAGPSSQPVIAAGDGGVLLVAFINAGQLYVVQATSAGAALSAPGDLFSGAENPAISMSNFGKAYLAFTAAGGAGGGDVRSAYWYQDQWSLEPTPLDVSAADAAGLSSDRPAVATAGDGVAIVAWGEGGHIYTRRVVGTTPSVVAEQADPGSFGGRQEVSATEPVIAAGGNSSYATVAFDETLATGGSTQTVVLYNRLRASQYDGPREADGATLGGPEGADQPAAAVTEYGRGFLTSELSSTHQLFAATLGTTDELYGTQRVDSLPNQGPPYAAPATAGLISNLIAWQQSPGIAGPAEIRVRYAADGADLGPEQVLSSPTLGDADAKLGLAAAGDVAGDAAVAWVQGSGASTYVVAAQLFQAPGGFVPGRAFAYSTSAQPTFRWSASNELWGAPQYVLSVDGANVAQTTAQQATATAPLTDGRHSWQVTASNRAGETTQARPAVVFVDTVAPLVNLRLRGRRIVGTRERITVSYRDLPPVGLPPQDASGVATVFVRWGDGHVQRIRRNDASHVYRRRRAYTITVTATDRAGNRTVVRARLRIRSKPKPKRHHRHRRHDRRRVAHRGRR
ncbi:MAG: hypothetical protein ACRDMX_11100 [Solirubrobacteraceae bacterium]